VSSTGWQSLGPTADALTCAGPRRPRGLTALIDYARCGGIGGLRERQPSGSVRHRQGAQERGPTEWPGPCEGMNLS
jgi:hypothetical protein